MEKQDTGIELTEERVREIVMEEIRRSIVPEELRRSPEATRGAKLESNPRIPA